MGVLRLLAFTWMGRAVVGLAAIGVIGATVIAPRLTTGAPAAALRTATVARGNVTQTVTVSGSVNPAATAKLSFGVAGRLLETLVRVGDVVKKDQALARLDTTDLTNAVKQQEANLLAAQARYDAALAGASAEDIAIGKNSIDQAQRSLEQTQKSAQNDLSAAQNSLAKVKTSYASGKDNFGTLTTSIPTDIDAYRQTIPRLAQKALGVRGALEERLGGDVTVARNALVSAEVSFAAADSFASGSVAPALTDHMNATGQVWAAANIFDRYIAEGRDTTPAIAMFQTAQSLLQTAAARLSSALDAPGGQISSAQTSINSAQAALTTASSRSDPGLEQPRIDVASILSNIAAEQQLATSMKSRISQATAAAATLGDAIGGSYVSAMQAVQTTQDKTSSTISGQENALRTAQLNFSKTTASPKQTDIASAYASVLSAEVALEKAKNDLARATLTAPSGGVVSSIAAQPGEFVASNPTTGIIVVAFTDTIALHGTVGEADIAKLKVNQVATIVVDALGSGTRLTGKVTGLDPVATLQQGVPVYGVDVTIDRPDPAVRAGMTGNATVIIQSKQGVLTVPNTAIRTQAGQRTVQVMRNGVTEDAVGVTFGISNDTVTEVTAGLQDGDTVVLPAPRTTTTTAGQGGQRQQIQVGGPGGAIPQGVPFR